MSIRWFCYIYTIHFQSSSAHSKAIVCIGSSRCPPLPPAIFVLSTSRPVSTNQYHVNIFLFHSFSQKHSHVMRCSPPDVIWNDEDRTFPKSFVPFIQVFTDKTATSLSSSASVAYPIHLVVLNTSAERLEWLLNNGLTILGFLPASVASVDDSKTDFSSNSLNTPSAYDASIIDLRDGISSTSSSSGRENNMLVLQNDI